MSDEVDLTIVTMLFDGSDVEALLGVLSNYVVLSRSHDGCRNIDFTASATRPGRFIIIEKWESPAHQQRHFDSEEMIRMARACEGKLASPPEIDLLQPISAHDLH